MALLIETNALRNNQSQPGHDGFALVKRKRGRQLSPHITLGSQTGTTPSSQLDSQTDSQLSIQPSTWPNEAPRKRRVGRPSFTEKAIENGSQTTFIAKTPISSQEIAAELIGATDDEL
jgi:hypothetical protein